MTDVNGVGDPNRIQRDTDYRHADPPAVRKVVTPLPVPPEDASAASFGPLSAPRRTSVATQHAAFVEPAGPMTPSEIQIRMDTFRDAATARFRVEGQDVRVAIAFRMTVDIGAERPIPATATGWLAQERIVQANEGQLQAATAKVGLRGEVGRLHEGRATPEIIRRVTQALIDEGHLPPASAAAPTLELRIRQLMFDHGIGMDCASYTRQSFLASRGERRGQTKLAPIENEDLSRLEKKGFAQVAIGDARPGDIVSFESLNPKEPGHRTIVYEAREATPEELKALRTVLGFGIGRVTLLMLDSSWGSSETFDHGGVERRAFWYCQDTKMWASRDTAPDAKAAFEVRPEEDLYPGHRLIGAFRPSQEAR